MNTNAARIFAFRYGAFRLLLTILGMGPGLSRVELSGDTLRVRMGWAFQATVPRDSITSAEAVTGLVGGIGVHGWGGRWLVNGAASGLVKMTIEPAGRARMVIPVKLTQLTVSLEDPDGFIAAVGKRRA
jgi:hypothetical protein